MLACLAIGTLLASASPAASQESAPPGVVDVIEVNGRIDPVLDDFVTRSLRQAEERATEVLVIQLDSQGSLVDDTRLDVLAFRLAHARVPVAVWVGPTGAEARGGAVRLMRAAAFTGMAPGTRAGRDPSAPDGHPFAGSSSLNPQQAEARGAVDSLAPTLGDFIVGLHGQTIGGRELRTARVVVQGSSPRREAVGQVRFAKLGLVERLLHTATSPRLAYLLLLAGLLLIVFEFFTAGVGLAAVTGAGCLLLAAYGLAVLPTSWLGLALIALAVAGFAIDVQSGAPRSWTVIGVLALGLGSWLLFADELRLSWISIVLGEVATVLFMTAAMPSVVRARFSTPTIGREWMIGEVGEATTTLDPEGTVRCRQGLWRARTNRATPVAAGEPVKVVAIEGVRLMVEPDVSEAEQRSAEPAT